MWAAELGDWGVVFLHFCKHTLRDTGLMVFDLGTRMGLVILPGHAKYPQNRFACCRSSPL